MSKRLDGKVIIITGSTRGIGRACALLCAKNGAKVVVNGRSDNDAMKECLSMIEEIGGEAVGIAADVSSRPDVERLVNETVEKYGTVDGLVNNAGVAPFVDFLEMDDETWDWTQTVNVKGLYLTTQTVARVMVKQKKPGRICNVTSISGVKATDPLQVPYCTSKGAANMLTRISAVALAEYNITVNAILPGTIETDLNRDILNEGGVRQSIVEATPLRCLGDCDDIGHAVVYFMSDESKWVTGTCLPIDGGFIA